MSEDLTTPHVTTQPVIIFTSLYMNYVAESAARKNLSIRATSDSSDSSAQIQEFVEDLKVKVSINVYCVATIGTSASFQNFFSTESRIIHVMADLNIIVVTGLTLVYWIDSGTRPRTRLPSQSTLEVLL